MPETYSSRNQLTEHQPLEVAVTSMVARNNNTVCEGRVGGVGKDAGRPDARTHAPHQSIGTRAVAGDREPNITIELIDRINHSNSCYREPWQPLDYTS